MAQDDLALFCLLAEREPTGMLTGTFPQRPRCSTSSGSGLGAPVLFLDCHTTSCQDTQISLFYLLRGTGRWLSG